MVFKKECEYCGSKLLIAYDIKESNNCPNCGACDFKIEIIRDNTAPQYYVTGVSGTYTPTCSGISYSY